MAERAEPHSRLDEISTRWSAVADPAAFVMRYGPAMRRYLEALLGRADDAEEVAQEFFLTVVRGGLARVQVPRGRFRHYLKTCLRNAAAAFAKRRRPGLLSDEQAAALADPAPDPASAAERVWVDDWRRCVLNRVWRVLEQHERKAPASLCFTVLRLAGNHPEETSEQLARRASDRTGRPLRAEAFRKQLSRARPLFRRLLTEEVAGTLSDPTPENLALELAELGLAVSGRPESRADAEALSDPPGPTEDAA